MPAQRKQRTPIQLPDEKAVRPTGKTVPVKPVKRSPKASEPLAAPALDRRRQITGTDEPKNRTR
jgi:hypothetical protein